jgi:glutathione synthase/RimK-type ligase-like ATP-grasp enzyme
MIRITTVTTFEVDSEDIAEAERILASKVDAGLVRCDDPRDDHVPQVLVTAVRLGTHVPRPSTAEVVPAYGS